MNYIKLMVVVLFFFRHACYVTHNWTNSPVAFCFFTSESAAARFLFRLLAANKSTAEQRLALNIPIVFFLVLANFQSFQFADRSWEKTHWRRVNDSKTSCCGGCNVCVICTTERSVWKFREHESLTTASNVTQMVRVFSLLDNTPDNVRL